MAEKRPKKPAKKKVTKKQSGVSNKNKPAMFKYDMDDLPSMIAKEVGIPQAQFTTKSTTPSYTEQTTPWPVKPQKPQHKRIMVIGVALFSIAISTLMLAQFSALFTDTLWNKNNDQTSTMINQVQEDLSKIKQEKEAVEKTTAKLKEEAAAAYKKAQMASALAEALKNTSTVQKALSLTAINTSTPTITTTTSTPNSTTTKSITP